MKQSKCDFHFGGYERHILLNKSKKTKEKIWTKILYQLAYDVR